MKSIVGGKIGRLFLNEFIMTRMLASGMGAPATNSTHAALPEPQLSDRDRAQMLALVAFTARSQRTARPRPFGASVVHSQSGRLLLRALNRVAQEIDPTAHAEVRAVRLATRKLHKVSLHGYTLYTTCEPCPMCMAAILWSGLDRVVYGATIEDANRHCNQIHIPAAEVAARGDLTCEVIGPFLREECYALFTHQKMLRAFRTWSTRKSNTRVTKS